VYGTVGLAHICEENNEYESLLHSFREQSRITGKPFASVDPAFLEAIAQGIPPMSGVCIGIDRMMAVVERCKHE
jgi:lysyl-tRNA synthetase class II